MDKQTGKYNDPQNKIDRNARVACVIPIFVPEKQIKEYMYRGITTKNDRHLIYKSYIENKLDSVKFTLACYDYYLSGIDIDIILVNNDSPDEETNEYLKNSIKSGIILLDRENKGFSFGAYKYVWEKFGDKYDYYLFHEQDIVPSKNNWLSDIVSVFLSDREIGAVGNVLENRGWGHPLSDQILNSSPSMKKRGYMYNFDGAFMFTSSKILKQVDGIGGLNIFGHKDIGPVLSEVTFQQPILELGYSLASYDNGIHTGNYLCTHGVALREEEPDDVKDLPIGPMLHGQTRHTLTKFKKHFSWYGDK